MFQPTYTMIGHNWRDERGAEGFGYIRALGSMLPNKLAQIIPEMRKNIQETFDEVYAQYESQNGLAQSIGRHCEAYQLEQVAEIYLLIS